MNTLKETQEKIQIMQAFLNGKEIEYKRDGDDFWITTQNPLWDWEYYDYRVIEAQKPKFKIGDEIVCRAQAEMPIHTTMTITAIADYEYILECNYIGQSSFKSSITFSDAKEHLLADEVLWYWEIIGKADNTDIYTMSGRRFKTEQEVREYYVDESLKFKYKRMMSLGFIIPEELKNERD